ncbi:transglycosylase SLT domain-containing protein [Roseibium sp.]|uniref:lytic transglycosylase domain-containing protein n=1 Tax=Roseibium sp. TaxID=1936156 RepID=UPI003BAEF689
MAAGSGSDPILHVIDPAKQASTPETKDSVGSGSKPILHVIASDADNKPAAKTKAASVKKKPTSKKSRSAHKTSKSSGAKTASRSVSKDNYAKLIRKAAAKHGVPVKIAKAVVEVESNFNPRARGSAGEVGLMQIKPATARGIGYRGSTKALYDPETNLEWGMKYLAGAHQRAGGDLCGTILRYNAGHYAKRMNPISRRYCSKVKRILASS